MKGYLVVRRSVIAASKPTFLNALAQLSEKTP